MASTEVGSAHVGIYPKVDSRAASSCGSTLGSALNAGVAKIGIGTAIGNIIAKGISTATGAISSSISGAINRVDILNNYPKVMVSLGYSADAAAASISKISDHLTGLPSSTDALASFVQQISATTGNIEQATDVGLAFNDMMLAGGKGSAAAESAMYQFNQILAKGKPEMQDWMTLVQTAPGQMKQLAQAMLGPTATADDLYKALGGGGATATKSMDDLMAAIIQLDAEGGEGFSSFAEQAKAATGGIGTSLENLNTALVRAGASVIESIGVDNITGAIAEMSNAIKGIGEVVNTFVIGIKNSLEGSGINNIVDSFKNAWTQALPEIKQDMTALGQAVGTVVAFIVNNLPTIIPVLKMATVAFITFKASMAVKGAVTKAQAAFSLLSGSLSSLGSNITQRLGGALSAASSAAANAGGGFKGLRAGIGAIASPVNIIMTALAALAAIFIHCYTTNEGFRNTVNGLISAIGAGLAPAFSSLQTLGQPLSAMFSALCNVGMQIIQVILQVAAALAPIISMLISMVVPILNMIRAVINAILPVVQSVLTVILGVIQTILPPIIEIVNAALTVILNIIQVVMPIIQTIITTVMNVISSVINTVWPAIQAIITTVMSAVQGIIDTVWPYIQNIIQSVMGVIQSIIQVVTSAISGDWSGVWNGICNLFKNIWNIIKNVVQGAIAVVRSIIESVLNIISSIWSGAWNAIGSFLQGAWDGITNAVSSGIDGVVNFFINLPNNILNALGDLGSLLVNAGKSIIDGLLSGIKNAVGAVWDFVGGIGEKIASLKGPEQYDLKLLIPNGQWIMQSLSTGLQRGMDGVENTLSDITTDISDFGFSGVMDNAIQSVKNGINTITSLIEDTNSTYAMQVQTAGASAYLNDTGLYSSNNGFQPLIINVNNAEVNSRPEMEKAVYDLLFELRRYGYTQGAK